MTTLPELNEGEKPRLEVSSGAVVFKRAKGGALVAMVKDSYGKWTFPKGHVRRGETLSEAAMRECLEETGLHDLRFRRKLGTIDIWFRDRYVYKGKMIHKFIHYFLLEAAPSARVRAPRHVEGGEKIQEVAWIPLSDLSERSAYKDMKKIVRLAMETVLKSERPGGDLRL